MSRDAINAVALAVDLSACVSAFCAFQRSPLECRTKLSQHAARRTDATRLIRPIRLILPPLVGNARQGGPDPDR